MTGNRTSVRRGFSIFEVMLGTFIVISMYVNSLDIQADYANNIRANSIASSMQQFSDAGAVWGKTYSEQLLKTLADNQIVEIPFSGNSGPVDGTTSLSQAGLIPFNYTPNLAFGQKIAVLVKKIPVSGTIPAHIEEMTATIKGTPFSDSLTGKVIGKLGGSGGAIFSVGPGAGMISGAYGTWKENPGDWSGGGETPQRGHVFLRRNTLTGSLSEFMDRFNISNPEANRMHTNLIDNNNKLNNVATVDGIRNQDLYISTTGTNNNVVMPANLTLCEQSQQGCGLTMGVDAYLENQRNGWTTFYQDQKGLHVTGDNGGNLAVDGAVYLPATTQDEDTDGDNASTHWVTGLIFGSNDTGGFGAHFFQSNNQFLTLTGSNGFTGISIQPQTGNAARLQLMQASLYSHDNGCCTPNGNLLSLVTPYSGISAIQHQNGSLADLDTNAVNLGQSRSITSSGQAYPAYKGQACSPNGRIASEATTSGHIMNCIGNIWYDVSDPYSNLSYRGYYSDYPGNNGTTTQFMELMGHRGSGAKGNPEFWIYVNNVQTCVNRYDTGGTNGNLFSSTVKYVNGTYTCTFPVPPKAAIKGANGGDIVTVYGLP